MLEPKTKTAPCVPAIRDAVAEWRSKDYPGVSDTTRKLLNYWFRADHRLPNGIPFRYHDSQKFAIETLVYLFEVVQVRRHKDLLEKYAVNLPNLRLLQYDNFARYCVKMATGSGKTKVMSLVIAWQYFNAVVEGRDDFARTFLLVAPNVIVYERLRLDFAGGKVFKTDPIIPPELSIFWDFDCYMRGDSERAYAQGALYVSNVQQLYEPTQRGNGSEPDAMTGVLGPAPRDLAADADDFAKRIVARGGPCLVINDEAHHTHDEESEWSRVIRQLHLEVKNGLAAQLDFTATPRFSKGSLFTWTVYDYPLKQAIIDNIVKRPMKGVANILEARTTIASRKYAGFLAAGVERWREYRELLKPFSKKPILFVMMNDTVEADDVGDFLRTRYPEEFGGEKLLIIHTDRAGEVSKRDLDAARRVAREVDQETNPVNAIVSVLMLREGWDVQNVTVVVGLRPYTAKANILPEQTIGRGLRLMFRGQSTSYTERVDVIGNKAFMEFVDRLEQEEDLELETFQVGKDKLVITLIQPDANKLDKDIAIPFLSPLLARKKSLSQEIEGLDVASFVCPVLPRKEGDDASRTFKYEGFDIISLQKIIERTYTVPEVQTVQEVISYYAKRIAQDVKLPSQFAVLAPKVREFLELKAFGETVNLDEPGMIKAVSSNVAQYVTVKTFVQALREVVVEQLVPTVINSGRALSETQPFPWSRTTLQAAKTVFNLVACDNDFERRFAAFLEGSQDVNAFAKLPERFGFSIDYTDSVGNLWYYEPDFVVLLDDGSLYLVETKGREDLDVAHKDRAAQVWCENVSVLTNTNWAYLKVPQQEFERLRPDTFSELGVLQSPLAL